MNTGADEHGTQAPGAAETRRELDLFDLVALAWSQRIFIVLISLLIFLPLAVAAYLALTPKYEATSRLLVIMDDTDLTPGAAGSGGAFMFDQVMQSEAELLNSEIVRRRMLESVAGAVDPLQLRALRSNFGVSRAPNASLLTAHYKAENAAVAANTLNAIVDAYLAYRVEVLVGSAESGVETRLLAAESAAEQAEAELRDFLLRHGISDFGSEREAALARASDLQARLLTAQAEADQARAFARALSARLAEIPETVELYVENSVTGQLLDLEVRRTELLTRYQPDAPPVQAVEREIAALERFVAEGRANGQGQRRTGVNPIWQELETARLQQESLAEGQSRLAASLSAQLDASRAQIDRLRALAPEHDRLVRAVTARAAAAEQLSVQAADAMARRGVPPGSADAVRVVERALPPTQPQSKRKLAVMAIAVLAGGIGGLAGLIRGYLIHVRTSPPPAPIRPRAQAETAAPGPSDTPPGPASGGASRSRLPVLARVSEF